MLETAVTPERILQLGFGFWASRTLLSAVELQVFTHLAEGPLTLAQLTDKCQIHTRSAADFFDALVAVGMLQREDGRYANTPESGVFLVKGSPAYVGGILEMCSTRLFECWGRLTTGLRTGLPQNEIQGEDEAFEALYKDPARMRSFLEAMTGISAGSARAIAAKFPWKEYQSFVDVGPAQGALPVQVALAHPHLHGIGYDLPAVGPIFEEYVRSHGLQDRVRFQAGDFMREPLPSADVIVMGHVLHDWGLKEKRMLVRKAYEALPTGGALVIHEAIIDDDRRKNAFGLLMSLNMLIETREGFDFTGADCCGWLQEAGFRDTRVEPLTGPDSIVIGIK